MSSIFSRSGDRLFRTEESEKEKGIEGPKAWFPGLYGDRMLRSFLFIRTAFALGGNIE